MASITSDFDTRAGSGTITLTHSSFPSTTFELDSVGKLGIQFDLEPEEEDASYLFFVPSEFTFSCFNQLGNGDSLFNTIDGIGTNDTVDVTLDFTTDGGHNFIDNFTFKKSDVNYEALKRLVEIESVFYVNGSTSISSLFTGNSGDVYSIDVDGGASPEEDYEAMPTREFIENVLNDANPDGTFVGDDSIFNTNPFVDDRFQFVVLEEPNLDNPKDSYEILYRLASWSGSVVGAVLGYNFFINRLDDTNSVTLTADDIENYRVGFGISNYKSIVMGLFQPPVVGSAGYGGADPSGFDLAYGRFFNREGVRTLDISFAPHQVTSAVWFSESPNFFWQRDFEVGTSVVDSLGEDADAGDYTIKLDGTPTTTVSSGDIVEINQEVYIVARADSTNNTITLHSPLQSSLTTSDFVNKLFIDTVNREGEGELSSPVIEGTNLPKNATNTYAYSFGANGARRVEFEIFDIDKMKPHMKIKTDGSLPEQVLQNKTFSPSEIEYNLADDKVTVKTYDITDA